MMYHLFQLHDMLKLINTSKSILKIIMKCNNNFCIAEFIF